MMMMMMEDYEKRSTEMTAKLLLLLLLLMAWFVEGRERGEEMAFFWKYHHLSGFNGMGQ